MPESDNDWRQQAHEDLGALHARVTATEGGIANVGRRVEELARDVNSLGNSFQRAISDMAKDLSASIDIVNSASMSARRTNWGTIATAAGVILDASLADLKHRA